jgi:hypothetical protein
MLRFGPRLCRGRGYGEHCVQTRVVNEKAESPRLVNDPLEWWTPKSTLALRVSASDVAVHADEPPFVNILGGIRRDAILAKEPSRSSNAIA